MNIRPYQAGDEQAIQAFRAFGAGYRGATVLRLVACLPSAAPIAHLYIVDRGTTASKRVGVCDMYLMVAPPHRRKGIGSALYERAMRFAAECGASRVKTWTDADREETLGFFQRRGWTEIEREYPSKLDVSAFEPEQFDEAIQRVETQGVRLLPYAEAGDTEENRRRLYDLITSIKNCHTWDENPVDAQEPFEYWIEEMERWPQETLLIAEADGKWVGVTTRPNWPYTGVLPRYQGRGIATALKVRQISLHKQREGAEPTVVETENHGQNAAMLAVNRKLGYVFGTPSVTLQKVLIEAE